MLKKEGYVHCPKCGKQFLHGFLDAHLRIHRQEQAEIAAESEGNPFDSTPHFFEAPTPNLDATKNMGYVRREVGKYGSHASYDPFDDESNS
jgi:hypothetical protein